MEVETETSTVVGELIASLEQATLMAKQLPTTNDPSQIFQIHSTLHSAHHRLSLFLSHHHLSPPPKPTTPPPPENSVSSVVGFGGGDIDETGGEPMQMGDEEDEQNSKAVTTSSATVDKVEERMRDCFIQNKRPKRPLSPSAAVAEQRRSCENEAMRGGILAAEFDPHATKLRSLDLIYQFHG